MNYAVKKCIYQVMFIMQWIIKTKYKIALPTLMSLEELTEHDEKYLEIISCCQLLKGIHSKLMKMRLINRNHFDFVYLFYTDSSFNLNTIPSLKK